ncbi:hypothetical protein [Curtobacterium sp. MCSS17_006]|uniref:hypothetical protein n=1 Tax=Curtobacterium sp. MCSS17_006 TaxID=2175642 RepID=UPI0011B72397|nr:hypothetical protein [Curtobacterium sp. MCSS17_006]
MIDPVDTDALRDLLVIGAPPLSAPAAGHDKWIGQVRLAGLAAADEVDRLRAKLADLPHDSGCQFSFLPDDKPRRCTCWKAELLP